MVNLTYCFKMLNDISMQELKYTIMNLKFASAVFLGVLVLNSCNNKSEDDKKNIEIQDNKNIAEKPSENVDIQVGDIKFTKSVNDAAKNVAVEGDKIIFNSKKGTDYFNSIDGAMTANSAPILLTSVDISKPFTFTAKVTPEFTNTGTYTAGVVYLYKNDSLYQKLCFEQDERGKHRVVTVRTVETSDDNNHDVINESYVYMKISSDGKTIGHYYSLDNKSWQMVRLYKNSYPEGTMLGISSQSPKQERNITVFENLKLEHTAVSDFRLGI